MYVYASCCLAVMIELMRSLILILYGACVSFSYLRRPYIVFTFRYLYGFMFVYMYVYLHFVLVVQSAILYKNEYFTFFLLDSRQTKY